MNIQYEWIHDVHGGPKNHDNLHLTVRIACSAQTIENALAEGIKLMMSPGKGALPVGQFDAQNLLPNGRGIPSLASSV